MAYFGSIYFANMGGGGGSKLFPSWAVRNSCLGEPIVCHRPLYGLLESGHFPPWTGDREQPISLNGAFLLLDGPFSDINGPFPRMPAWAIVPHEDLLENSP